MRRAFGRLARWLTALQGTSSLSEACLALARDPGCWCRRNHLPPIQEILRDLLQGREVELATRLEKQAPPGMRCLLRIRGLPPLSIHRLWKQHGISDLSGLVGFLQKGGGIPGLDRRTQVFIRASARALQAQQGGMLRTAACFVAGNLVDHCLALPGVLAARITGDLARGEEVVHRVEVVLALKSEARKHGGLSAQHQKGSETLRSEARKYGGLSLPFLESPRRRTYPWGMVINGVFSSRSVRLICVPPSRYGVASYLGASSREHHRWVEETLLRSPPGQGVSVGASEAEDVMDEEAWCRRMGKTWLPPELRQGRQWPLGPLSLVAEEDLQGDLHLHTSWTHGAGTPETMIEAAIARGYHYLAITEHSRSVAEAGGLAPRQIPEYVRRIRDLGCRYPRIRLLAGMEVDIREDGTLDLPESSLEQLDVVIASIHSGFDLSMAGQVQRLKRGMAHPRVSILGHPTGRLLTRAPPLPVPWNTLVRLAAENRVCLELNCRENRLDAPWKLLRQARDAGVDIVVSTDAHDVSHLDQRGFGVLQARRAGLSRSHVLNTRNVEEVLRRLHTR